MTGGKRVIVRGRDSRGVPKQTFADGIRAMDDATFDAALRRAAWLSSFARTQPGSDFHWQLDVFAREASVRGRPSGGDTPRASATDQCAADGARA